MNDLRGCTMSGATPATLAAYERAVAAWQAWRRDDGGALATGASVDDVRAWPERIRAVNEASVREAARRWLDKRRSVTGYLVKDARSEEKRS